MRGLLLCLALLCLFGIGADRRAQSWPVHGNTYACWTPGPGGFTRWADCAVTGSGSCSTGTYTGTCIVYVDESAGGACTPQTPPFTNTPNAAITCTTITAAASKLRDGKPDWLMLKSGATYTNELLGVAAPIGTRVSGQSTTAPMLYGAYGGGTRPLLSTDLATSVSGIFQPNHGGGNFTAIIGLEFYSATRDPANGGFSLTDAAGENAGIKYVSLSTDWVLIEDCKFSFFYENIDVNNAATVKAGSLFQIRRNIIVNAYAGDNGNTQGIFMDGISSALFQENLFDTNGWNPTLATPAAVTLASTSGLGTAIIVTWTGNKLTNGNTLFFDAAAVGLSANTAYCVANLSGATFNLKIGNCSGVVLNSSGSASGSANAQWLEPSKNKFRRNLYFAQNNGTNVTFTGNISTNSASTGVQMRTGGFLTNNFFDSDPIGFSFGCAVDPGCVPRSQGYAYHNVVMHSNDTNATEGNTGQGIDVGNFTSGFQGTTNIFAHQSSGGTNFAAILEASVSSSSFTSNILCDWSGNYIQDAGTGNNTTSPPNSTASVCSSSRDISSYSLANGISPATLAGFVAQASVRPAGTWNTTFTAGAVNSYIRDGFGQN